LCLLSQGQNDRELRRRRLRWQLVRAHSVQPRCRLSPRPQPRRLWPPNAHLALLGSCLPHLHISCLCTLLLFSFLLCLSLCSMFMAPYDWRLSFRHMQLRDFFFTKVRLCNENAWSTAFSSIKLSPLSRADSFPFLRFVCGLYLHSAAQVDDRNRQARQPQSVSGDTVGPTR